MATGLFVGLTTIDIFNVVDHYPSANQKVRADQQSVYAGGPAANAAVAFAALGNDPVLLTGLGCHPVAALAASELHAHGVAVHDHAADPRALPVISSIIVDASTGDRTVVYTNTRGRTLEPGYPYGQLTEGCGIALFDGFYLGQAVPIAKVLKGNLPTVLDGGSWKDGLDSLLPYIDYAICSEDFMPPGCASHEDLFDYLSAKGVSGCAISRGPEPILWCAAAQQSALKVPTADVVDTLGAGDILHGSFCHHILSNSFEKSLHLAALTASESCRYYGTREWISHL